MKFAILRFLAGALFLLSAPTAEASGDFSCTSRWTLRRADPVCNNLAFLNPGNDSRVNLQLLRADQNLATFPEKVAPDEASAPRDRDAPFEIADLTPDYRADEDETQQKTAGDETRKQRDALNALASQLEIPPFAGDPPAFAKGEGSRCRSNTLPSALAFLQQVAAAPIPREERQTLAKTRLFLLQGCDFDAAEPGKIAALPLASAAAQDFARYLSAATAFYNADFATALSAFQALNRSTQPWLKETALYMTARSHLNLAQKAVTNQWGDLDRNTADKAALAAAEAGFQAYLTTYPKGLYATSAQGLRRRVAWLSQDGAALASAYARLLAQPDANRPMAVFPDPVQEVDLKFLREQNPSAEIQDPLLLAVLDLLQMRRDPDISPPPPPSPSLADLTAQQPVFAAQPRLYRYLLSVHALYRLDNPAKALETLPDKAPDGPPDYLTFSEQILRGLALEAKGETAEAQKLWLTLLPLVHRPLQKPAVELALAMNYERNGQLDTLFAAGSPISSREIRRVLLVHVAKAELLRKTAQNSAADERERATALFTLLYKELTHGAYAGFLSDLALLPPQPAAGNPVLPFQEQAISPAALSLFQWPGGELPDHHISCPSLRATVALLKDNPGSSKGLLCFGEFILGNGLDGYFLEQPVNKADLGGTPEQFAGPHMTRLDGYQRIMADPTAPPEDQAYALFRAINCFASSGNNSCSAQDIPKKDRKAWFQRLKGTYKNSVWAQELKYYW